jgi:succinate dehydrogenase/fumarate reductase flavoprotein subunit
MEADVVVVGSGAGALSVAVTAAHLGLSVIVVEKTETIGGTTAWSGGWMWIPRNPLARAAGINETIDAPKEYLRRMLGKQYDETRAHAFLTHAPAMVQFHIDHTALKFIDGNTIPDFHGNAPGAVKGGRSVCAAPFEAEQLGRAMKLLRPPRDILSFLGMSIGGDVRHFLRAGRAWDSFCYVAKRIAQHALDIARTGQGSTRMGGNALVAALLKSALDKNVAFLTQHAVVDLITINEKVVGIRAHCAAGMVEIRARKAVVLACGGFPHDALRHAQLFPHVHADQAHYSAAPRTNTGDGLRLGESVGAVVDDTLLNAGAWAPVSLVPHADGRVSHFPHLIERGKPGLIAVMKNGKRFVSEAGNYHSFMRALFAAGATEAWLICDHRFQRRFGLGFSKPFPLPISSELRRRYLLRGTTIEVLARECGIDPQGLRTTMDAYNAHARNGEDPQFHRGEIPYERMQGDAEHTGPNPCVAAIEHGPFYAVRVVPGSLGTFAGLKVNEHAQALNARGTPIDGLYVAGNDMASVMGGHYPSGGITLGPAMTFGFIAGHHIAGVALEARQ